MVGEIRNWDILTHPIATICCFGWRIFFKAAFSWQAKTFLSLLQENGFFEAAGSTVPEVFRRCIGIELQAKRVYAALARMFAETESTRQFFEVLAQQEQAHADLLEICRAAASRGGWRAEHLSSWQGLLPRLEQQMQVIEDSLTSIGSSEDALRLVIQIGRPKSINCFWASSRRRISPSFGQCGLFETRWISTLPTSASDFPNWLPSWQRPAVN